MKKWYTVIALLIVLTVLASGCNMPKLTGDKPQKDEMIKVEVAFDKDTVLSGYVETLDIGKASTVYTGGVTSTNLYDDKGNITAVFNYSKAQYIKVVK